MRCKTSRSLGVMSGLIIEDRRDPDLAVGRCAVRKEVEVDI